MLSELDSARLGAAAYKGPWRSRSRLPLCNPPRPCYALLACTTTISLVIQLLISNAYADEYARSKPEPALGAYNHFYHPLRQLHSDKSCETNHVSVRQDSSQCLIDNGAPLGDGIKALSQRLYSFGRNFKNPSGTPVTFERAFRDLVYAYPLYESTSFRMYIHREGQKALMRNLSERKDASITQNEWSWLQSGFDNAPSTDGITARETFKTRSRLQMYLDVLCQNTIKYGKLAFARFNRGEIRCIDADDMDPQLTGTCLDVCFNEFSCVGGPATQDVWDSSISLRINREDLFQSMCVTSPLQKKLDEKFCIPGQYIRFDEAKNMWNCHSWRQDRTQNGMLRCLDDCGALVSCINPGPVQHPVNTPLVENYARQNKSKQCDCEERMIDGNTYTGCQSRTKLGKTCQAWNVDVPHPHDVNKRETHNYCRRFEGDDGIWCFTTDPDIRFDYCDPLGVKQQSVQVGEKFDIVLQGTDLSTFYELAMFPVVDGKAKCGGKGRRIDGTHIIFDGIDGKSKSPNFIIREGQTKALIWENATIATAATGAYAICLCDSYYFVVGLNNCKEDSHYTIHAGTLHVTGPSPSTDVLELETGKPYSMVVEGSGMTLEDRIVVLKASSMNHCDGSVLSFAASMVGLYQSSASGAALLSKGLIAAESIAANVSAVSVRETSGKASQTFSSFTLKQSGEYIACWQQGGSESAFLVRKIIVNGIDIDLEFPALYAPSATGTNQRPFPIFIPCRGTVELPARDAISFHKTSGDACQGDVVGRSRETSFLQSYNSGENDSRKIIQASLINIDALLDESGNYDATLELCMASEGISKHLGYATVASSLTYGLAELGLSHVGTSESPSGTHTMSIQAYSIIGLHWINADPSYFFVNDLAAFFTKGDFRKVLNFWVDSEAISVLTSTYSNLAPSLLARFKVSDAVAVAVEANLEGVYFYVGKVNPSRVEKYDMTYPMDLTKLTSTANTLGDVRIEYPGTVVALTCDSFETLVLVLDRHGRNLHLFDSTLNLIESKRMWEGMSWALQDPLSLNCMKTPSGTVGAATDTWDCYIIDKADGRVILIRYGVESRASTFVTEFLSDNGGAERLIDPVAIVAYAYNDQTLLYVAQEEYTGPMLLAKAYSDNVIRLYKSQDGASRRILQVDSLIIYETSDADAGLESIWLATFGRSVMGPMVELTPLDTTATAPEFKYFPKDWYALGEEHTLEPSIVGVGSQYGLNRFVLSSERPASAYVKRNISIDETTGKITLHLGEIVESEVTVEVTGIGIVNSVKSSFTFRVACRDGHYYRGGMCVKCEAGSFNSIAQVKADPSRYFTACKQCEENRSTVAEGSTSNDQCLCQKGYQIDESVSATACTPCPAGSFKDTIADSMCIGNCPTYSISHIEGAASESDRMCSCLPGYYSVETDDTIQCSPVEKGFYSTGGYRAQKVPCPDFTTTVLEDGRADGLEHCLCQAGYSPAKREDLWEPTSPASRLKLWLRLNPAYKTLSDSQVCMPCGRRHYKGEASADACTECPLNSFSSSDGPTEKRSCNMCIAGYYATENEDMPCGECQEDHFCVGSEPALPELTMFAGQKVTCSANTKTHQSNAKNSHPYNCMCETGYVYEGINQATGKVICSEAYYGEYKDSIGNVGAAQCPPGSNTISTTSGSLEDCVCSAGYFLDINTKHCEGLACPGVSYQFFERENTTCDYVQTQPCPIGAYCIGGRDPQTGDHMPPLSCPENTNTKDLKSESIEDCVCDKGFYRTLSQGSDSVTCQKCSINSYKDWTGNEPCKQCSENSGTNGTGSVSSAQCLCRPGYYYDGQIGECTACRSPYKYCPGGEMDCAEGDPLCVGGKKPIQPQDCPEHTRISEGFDMPSSIDDCKCDRGYAFRYLDLNANLKVCEPCSAGSYKSSVQDINCNGLCGVSSTSVPGAQAQSQCFCEEGTYYASGACHTCPAGAVCAGGLTDSAIETLKRDPSFTDITAEDHIMPYAEKGYYLNKLTENLESTNDWQFIKCPIERACLEHGVCSATMTDYLCSECREGYTNGFNKGEICTVCPPMATNTLLLIGYYIGTLSLNIAMAYMNVAAGFNRRSIHSIVIKIASNFFTCMSILSVVEYDRITFPTWITSLTTTVTETMVTKERNHMTSVECLLRERLSLSFADSFFYTTLFHALLPIALPLITTVMMFFFVDRVRYFYRNSIKKKLKLLEETANYGLIALTEQLREKYDEDRAFMIFRYIPLPGESVWRRFQKFMEDMIPIYVTVLFFIYTSTSRRMLSLLDCSYIDFGGTHGSKYFLRAAMSIECDIHPGSPYFKFFSLGIIGIAMWSIGIPLGAFLVLYTNRKSLNSRETRLKYGFLHNGFVKKFWFWETVVFARKLSVLIISSVFLIPTSDQSGARLWLSFVTAVAFNIYHLRSQPFDKRNYSTLDNLENHSMGIWTLTLGVVTIIFGSSFSGEVNMALALVILVAILLFAFEVGINLLFAYFDNVRANRSFFDYPVIGYIFRAFARLSEKRKSREPIVVYDAENDIIQLVAAKRQSAIKRGNGNHARKINSKERSYFIKVMSETLGFAVMHMKLDVIPGPFLEFALRLGLAFHKMDEDTQKNKKSLQAIAGGDLSMIANWSKQQKEAQRKRTLHLRKNISLETPLNPYYKHLKKKLKHGKKQSSVGGSFSPFDEERRERLRDLEGGLSDDDPEMRDKNEPEEAGEVNIDDVSLNQCLSEMSGEDQQEAVYLFDHDMMDCGIPLSELYLALMKLQLKEATTISQQFEVFKVKKKLIQTETADLLKARNRKLCLIRYALQAVLEGPDEMDILSLGLTQEAHDSLKEKLSRLRRKQQIMNEQLCRLKNDPDSYEGEDLEQEWVGLDHADDSARKQQEENDESFSESDWSSSADSASTSGRRVYTIYGKDAEDWEEDFGDDKSPDD